MSDRRAAASILVSPPKQADAPGSIRASGPDHRFDQLASGLLGFFVGQSSWDLLLDGAAVPSTAISSANRPQLLPNGKSDPYLSPGLKTDNGIVHKVGEPLTHRDALEAMSPEAGEAFIDAGHPQRRQPVRLQERQGAGPVARDRYADKEPGSLDAPHTARPERGQSARLPRR
jgi:hypothetical protein